jgi:hypothetical protein
MKRSSLEPDYIRGLVRELIPRCPWTQDNPTDCPLHPVRQLSSYHRTEWVNALSPQAAEDMFVRHWHCLERKVLARRASGQDSETTA